MLRHHKRLLGWILIFLVGLLTACDGRGGGGGNVNNPGSDRPANAIDVTILYSPEEALYLPQAISDFNKAYASGKNPVTGQALASGEKPIYVTDLTNGQGASAGTVMQGLVNAIIAPNNQNVAKPIIFAPSVSHWLALANEQSGRQLFDMSNIQPTALAPVVMAIWESRLNAIRQKVGRQDIGWEELLQVLQSPNGWCDYGIPNCRRTVYYGHTDPYISSTALSTLIAEFYASARQNGFTGRQLGLDQVRDAKVQTGVRNIEQLIRHYSSRTTEFKQYIAQGPDYLDFVALEENDLIFINQGKTDTKPPEKLVALYPKEGTFWHEHPFGIVNADWVTQEQKDAAAVFTKYILSKPIQEAVMAQGFRPVSSEVTLAFPFVEENGVTKEGPKTVLDVPSSKVIVAIQQSWSLVKKQADIMLIIDISGSMNDQDKIGQAKQAALAFLDKMDAGNRVGLVVFNDQIHTLVPIGNLESVKATMVDAINNLRADGSTALFDAVTQVVTDMNQDKDDKRIRAVVLLSDGADTASQKVLNDALGAITASRDSLNPVIFVPVAYGSDADVSTLNGIARASATAVQSGDPKNILRVLQIIGSFF
jgi:Ca-activated chloride channel family protein